MGKRLVTEHAIFGGADQLHLGRLFQAYSFRDQVPPKSGTLTELRLEIVKRQRKKRGAVVATRIVNVFIRVTAIRWDAGLKKWRISGDYLTSPGGPSTGLTAECLYQPKLTEQELHDGASHGALLVYSS